MTAGALAAAPELMVARESDFRPLAVVTDELTFDTCFSGVLPNGHALTAVRCSNFLQNLFVSVARFITGQSSD